MQIPQHGHPCSLQNNWNFPLCSEIEQLINEMTEIICKIRQNRETNSSAVREQKIIIENEIRKFRTKINNMSILYDSLVWFRLSLLSIDCRHVSWVSTCFSIIFTAIYVCRSDAYFLCWLHLSGIRSVLSVSRLEIPVVRVFRLLHVFLLKSIPSKLPSYVLESKEHCDEHHEKFSLYCKEHGRPCCRICFVEKHGDCKNVTILLFNLGCRC
jgi:hypothetical protein